MRTALIGYTGFVGSNLVKQYNFTDLYNSKNFKEMKNQSYDLIICAGVSAVKWMANKEPKKDLEDIELLQDILKTVDAKKFVLVSTIDVYASYQKLDEDFECNYLKNHPYGTHRLAFEDFCSAKFHESYIVRLPGLFGDGIKKNIIYDLLNSNCLDMINPKSSFQYYFLANLYKDINIAMDNDVKLINLFTEPISTQEIMDISFSNIHINDNKADEFHYNLYSKNAKYWNKKGNYIYTKDEIKEQLIEFISQYKGGSN